MSATRRRLPLFAPHGSALPPVDLSTRRRPARASVGLVAAHPADEGGIEAARSRWVACCAKRGIRSSVLVVEAGRPTSSDDPDIPAPRQLSDGSLRLAAPLSDIASSIDRALGNLEPVDILLGLGPAFVASLRPTLAILLTEGRAPSEWSAEARALRRAFDLVLPSLDTALVDALLDEIVRIRAIHAPS